MTNIWIEQGLESIEKILESKSKFFSRKKFLITGGAGFLGSWLIDILIRFNAKIICLDNFSTGLSSNVNHLQKSSDFKLIDSDICNYMNFDGLDGIFHFAGRASPDDYVRNQIETLRIGSIGIGNILELANKNNCFLAYASTSEVYGDAKIVPTPEDYWGYVNPIGIRSCYDEGKRFGESLCMAYKREKNTNVKIIRIFNTYGPRIRPDGIYGRAISRFIFQALNDRDITICGDGRQTRSFCYVTDTITGILKYVLSDCDKDVLNFGNTHEISINELVSMILQKTNSKSKVLYEKASPDDPRRRSPDISNAKKFLDWEPTINLDEGLTNMIRWMKSKNIIESDTYKL